VKLLGVFDFRRVYGLCGRSPAWRVSSGFIAHSVSSITRVLPQRTLCGGAVVCVVGGTISFWFRRWFTSGRAVSSTEADAFARATMGEAQPLVQALRKLTDRNRLERVRRQVAEVFLVSLRSACTSGCASPMVARANASASYSKRRDQM